MTGDVAAGRRALVLRRGALSVRIDLRSAVTAIVLLALLLGVCGLSLAFGEVRLSAGQIADVLWGSPGLHEWTIVTQWRLPRLLLALTLGAALGISGAIFQSLTRNPLGSPDVIGFNTGAHTGALIAILVAGGGYLLTAAGAMAGGLVTAVSVYALAYKRGLQGFRLIIVGIAVSAFLGAVNTWLIVRADLSTALVAAVWGAGSLNGASWQQVVPAAVVLLCLAPALVHFGRSMPALEMGDDTAAALGVRPEFLRRSLLVTGVALTALATAAAGPISFIALAAPQLARRIVKGSRTGLFTAALVGALLLSCSDWIAQHGLVGTSMPVGVVTVAVGGCYLLWLIVREARRA